MMMRLLAGFAATALLAGCAVTKIDVDVYKGPLANHEQVQDQQLAVMATALEPLLRRLRDDLERRSLQKRVEAGETIDLTQYRLGFPDRYKYKSPEAQRVTAILTLYDDNVIPGFEHVVAKIERDVHDYVTQWDILSSAGDQSFWSTISPGLRSDLSQPEQDLRDEIRLLLDYSKRQTDFSASRIAVALSKPGATARLGSPRANEKIFPDRASSNLVFEELSGTKLPEALRDILFSDERTSERDLFVRKSKSVGDAFIAARAALKRMWDYSTGELATVHNGGYPLLTQEQRRQLTAALATYVSKLTQPRFVAHALCNGYLPGLKAMLEHESSGSAWKPKKWDDLNYRITTDAIAAVLTEEASSVAMLVQTDKLVPTINNDGCDAPYYMSGLGRRKYGVVRGPTVRDVDNELSRATLVAAFRRFADGAAAGLEHGRLPKGLHHLIEDYLLLASTAAKNGRKDELQQAQGDLPDALVQFAQKVLALADNDVLFPQQISATRGTQREKVQDLDTDLNVYVVVLQSVGNSLLIHADELRHRQTHKRRLTERQPSERAALDRAMERGGPDYIAQLIGDLRAQATATGAQQDAAEAAKAAADNEVRRLEGILSQKEQALTAATNAANATKQSVFDPVRARFDPINAACDAMTGAHAGPLKAMLPTTNPITATALIEFVATKIDAATATGAQYLLTHKMNTGIADGPPATVFDAVVAMLEKERALHKSYLDPAESEWKAAVRTEAKARDDRDEARWEHEKAKETAAEKAKLVTVATLSEDRYAAAAHAIEERHALILTRVGSGARVASAAQAHEALRAVLSEAQRLAVQGTSQADTTLAAHLQWTIDYVAKQNPPLGPPRMPRPAVTDRNENARDVLDQLIAALRHEHILAVRDGGAESANAKKLEQSIKAAYDHRSGMAYIRPSSAYLRSSYTATSLQQDAGLAWQNLLTRAGERSSPLFSEGLVNSGDEARLKVVGALDKQFWQNINSVRVSGAGLTNYVMAKDDIGNWYVKAYSSDAKSIIQSARNLALFNLGASANLDFLSKAKAEDARERGEMLPDRSDKTPLERLLESHRGAYAERTKLDLDDALVLDKALGTRVAAAWDGLKLESERAKLTPILDTARSEMEAALAQLKADTKTDSGLRIASALQHGRRFYQTIAARIDASDLKAETKEPARKEAARVSRNTLDDFVRRRQSTTRDYEQSLTFIGQASK